MTFPRRRRNWKTIHPRNLREAFRLCKDHARESKNLGVERIAELIGVSADLLYKWLANGEMRAALVPVYENVCGIHYVTEYLAAGANRIVIEIPTGRRPSDMDTSELQVVCTEAVAHLMRFYRGETEQEETEEQLTQAVKGLVWHRENVHKADRPELDLAGDK